MEIELSDIWITAIFLIGLQIAAFTWRVSREIALAGHYDPYTKGPRSDDYATKQEITAYLVRANVLNRHLKLHIPANRYT